MTHTSDYIYEDVEFVQNHLNVPESNDSLRKLHDETEKALRFVQKSMIARSDYARLSIALAEILNTYSKKLHGTSSLLS